MPSRKTLVGWVGWLDMREPMLELFGPGFAAGYPLLFLLVLGVVARAAVGPCESLLTMSGHQNVCAMVYALTLVVNIGLSMVLIPHFGLWGAAIATALSMAFEVLTADSRLAGAALVMEETPVLLRCRDCSREFTPDPPTAAFAPCPGCGQELGHTVVSGRELYIEYLELE